MRTLKLDTDYIIQAQPAGLRTQRLAAILLAHLTWPNNGVAREGFLLEPLAPRTDTDPTGQSQLIQALDVGLEKIDRCLKFAEGQVGSLPDLLGAAREAVSLARDLASTGGPTSDHAAMAQMANYFAGFDPDGRTHSAVSHTGRRALADEIRKRVPDWYLAGLQLFLVAQMRLHHMEASRGEPSLRKAQNIICDRTKWNKTQLKNAWTANMCVAHLAAGAIQVTQGVVLKKPIEKWRPDLLRASINGKPETVVRFAKAFQVFGLSFKPKRAAKPILSATDFWHLGGKAEPLDAFLKPLEAGDLEALLRVGAER